MMGSDPPRLVGLGRHMPRKRYEEGHVRKAGKRRRVWIGEYHTYDAAGTRHHHTVELGIRKNLSKADAHIQLRAHIQKARGEFVLSAEITFGAWIERYLAVKAGTWTRNSRENIASMFRRHILPKFGEMPLRAIRKSDIQLLLLGMADHYSRATIQLVLGCASGAFSAAVDDKLIDSNPTLRVKIPATKTQGRNNRALTLTEARRLISSLSGADRLQARILLAIGARIGELFALTRSDVIPGGIVLDEGSDRGVAIPTKSRKVEVQPIPASLQTELTMWLETVDPSPEALLFPGRGGRMAWRQTEGAELLARFRSNSGIKDLTFHMLRRTFATLLDADSGDVRDLLRHSHVETTLQHYRKPIIERQRASVEALDAKLRG